jgi:hypothetical protein
MVTQYGASFTRFGDHQSSRLSARSDVPYRQATDQSHRQLTSLPTEHGSGTGCQALNVTFVTPSYMSMDYVLVMALCCFYGLRTCDVSLFYLWTV